MAEYFAGGHLRFLDGEWRDDNGDVVEIREVKYGHWISNEFGRIFICSECSEMRGQKEKYCPNCGVNMEGVTEQYESNCTR